VAMWQLVFGRSLPYGRQDSLGPVHQNVVPGAGAKSALCDCYDLLLIVIIATLTHKHRQAAAKPAACLYPVHHFQGRKREGRRGKDRGSGEREVEWKKGGEQIEGQGKLRERWQGKKGK